MGSAACAVPGSLHLRAEFAGEPRFWLHGWVRPIATALCAGKHPTVIKKKAVHGSPPWPVEAAVERAQAHAGAAHLASHHHRRRRPCRRLAYTPSQRGGSFPHLRTCASPSVNFLLDVAASVGLTLVGDWEPLTRQTRPLQRVGHDRCHREGRVLLPYLWHAPR